MNGSSNSVQHSTLLATEQVCRAHSCARAVRVVGSVLCAAPPLVRALMRVPRPVVRASSALSRVQAWSVGRNKNSSSQHHPWKPCRDIKSSVATEMASFGKTLSWHKGDPCRDPSTQSQPHTLSRHKIYVVIRGQKSLSRPKPLSQPKPPSMSGNSVTTWKSLSQHRARKLCQARVSQPHAHVCRARPGRVVRLA